MCPSRQRGFRLGGDDPVGPDDDFLFLGSIGAAKVLIKAFDRTEGDVIGLSGTGLTSFDDLPGHIITNGDSVIDLGAALGEGSSVIIVAGVTDLEEADFLF